MSILLAADEGWIISHLDYLNNIYKCVQHKQQHKTLQFNESLFKLTSQYLRQNQIESGNRIENGKYSDISKRKRNIIHGKLSPDILQQNDFVKKASFNILKEAETLKFFKNVHEDNNVQSREESKKFYTTFLCSKYNYQGSNKNKIPIIAEFQEEKYVFPEYSEFYCYDIKQMHEVFGSSKNFDLIVLDPPWWNKSIRRKKKKLKESSYNMMYNKDLASIPIGNYLSSKGIVAVWCTNCTTHLNSILNEMFPNWGVTFLAKWYWLKITQNGKIICNFSDTHGKQPYEQLIFGTVNTNLDIKIPDQKIIISVPSSVHSHKPPLTEILKFYLPEHCKCMEIFARYLLPKWTSWGLEVLKFQHLSLYTTFEREETSENIDI